MGHRRPTGAPLPQRHHTRKGKGTGKGRARDGKGHPQEGARRGPQAPTGTGQRGQHNTGVGNHPRAKKGRDQRRCRRERGTIGGHQGTHTGRACDNRGTSTAPAPADTARPPEAHARQHMPPKYGPHRLTPSGHRRPHRGVRAHPHGEKGLQPPRELPRTLPRSPPLRPHRQATTPATARATSQAPEEAEDTAAPPRR